MYKTRRDSEAGGPAVRQFHIDSRRKRQPILNYVVDASVVLKWFLPESDSAEAEGLLRAFLSGKASLYAPDLILIETASALWRRTIVRAEVSPGDARAMYRDLLTLPLNLQPSDRLAAAAFSLALLHRHSVYDAFYCALAAEIDCAFITADRTLVTKLAKTLPYIQHVSTIKL